MIPTKVKSTLDLFPMETTEETIMEKKQENFLHREMMKRIINDNSEITYSSKERNIFWRDKASQNSSQANKKLRKVDAQINTL